MDILKPSFPLMIFNDLSPQILQGSIISHPRQRALGVPGETERGCRRWMAWRQSRFQRLGGQGEVHLSRHGQGQGTREIPVIGAGPTVQLRRARVWGDMSSRGAPPKSLIWIYYLIEEKRKKKGAWRDECAGASVCVCVDFVYVFMLITGRVH